MGKRRAGGARKKQAESRWPLFAAVGGVLLFFVIALFALVPLLLWLLVAALRIEPQEMASSWQLAPEFWVVVAVFCAPLALAVAAGLLVGLFNQSWWQAAGAQRWAAVATVLAGAYSLAVQAHALTGFGDQAVFAADVLRVAAYPQLVLLLGTLVAIGARRTWAHRKGPRVTALLYLLAAVVAVVAVGWLNAGRYA